MDVHYNGAKGLPSSFRCLECVFIMPTLADKYIYKGLSGETYRIEMQVSGKGYLRSKQI